MGWKNFKERYRIGHMVQVTEKGICIGSPYIHNLIVISLDGVIIKADDGRVNEDLKRYMAEMRADPEMLRQVIQAPDAFGPTVPVYTYDGGNIIQKQCEELGWPNVTTDGDMMYENTFSADKSETVKRAKVSATCSIESRQRRIQEIKFDLAEMEKYLKEAESNLSKLEKDYPK